MLSTLLLTLSLSVAGSPETLNLNQLSVHAYEEAIWPPDEDEYEMPEPATKCQIEVVGKGRYIITAPNGETYGATSTGELLGILNDHCKSKPKTGES